MGLVLAYIAALADGVFHFTAIFEKSYGLDAISGGGVRRRAARARAVRRQHNKPSAAEPHWAWEGYARARAGRSLTQLKLVSCLSGYWLKLGA